MAFVDDGKFMRKFFGKKLYISVSESVVFRNPQPFGVRDAVP